MDYVKCSNCAPLAVTHALRLDCHQSIAISMTDAGCLTNCQSDVTLTYWYLTQDVDRQAPLALPTFCNPQNWSLGGKKTTDWNERYDEVRRLATKHLDGRACTVIWRTVLLKLKLILYSQLCKDRKHACDRKFIAVYVYQKLSK